MPLTGEAKRNWQREYMRKRRQEASQVARVISRAVDPQRGRPPKGSDSTSGAAKTVLGLTLQAKGLPLDRVIGKLAEKLEATKEQTVAGVAIMAPDNDAQLRATDQAIRLHERAGTIPPAKESAPKNTSRFRMVEILPDSTERVIEIATG